MSKVYNVTVTISRNYGTVAGDLANRPMPGLAWDDFQADTLELLESFAGASNALEYWIEQHTGTVFWGVVPEESIKFGLFLEGVSLKPSAAATLVTGLENLVRVYQQDSLAVTHGDAVLLENAKLFSKK